MLSHVHAAWWGEEREEGWRTKWFQKIRSRNRQREKRDDNTRDVLVPAPPSAPSAALRGVATQAWSLRILNVQTRFAWHIYAVAFGTVPNRHIHN